MRHFRVSAALERATLTIVDDVKPCVALGLKDSEDTMILLVGKSA